MMESKNEKQEEYEYSLLTVFDEDGLGIDYSIDYLFDNGLEHCKKRRESVI